MSQKLMIQKNRLKQEKVQHLGESTLFLFNSHYACFNFKLNLFLIIVM